MYRSTWLRGAFGSTGLSYTGIWRKVDCCDVVAADVTWEEEEEEEGSNATDATSKEGQVGWRRTEGTMSESRAICATRGRGSIVELTTMRLHPCLPTTTRGIIVNVTGTRTRRAATTDKDGVMVGGHRQGQ